MMMSETVTNLELIAKTLYGSPPPCYICKKKPPSYQTKSFFFKRKSLTYFIWYFIGLVDGFHKVSILKKCIEIIQVFVQHELRIQHAKNVYYFVRTYEERENYRLRNCNSKNVFNMEEILTLLKSSELIINIFNMNLMFWLKHWNF